MITRRRCGTCGMELPPDATEELCPNCAEQMETTAILNRFVMKPGDRIGRYRLLEQIGEGGYGVVYMADQEEPVRRRVALKVIKLGMDTREVIARFEAERQALAMMDHPNIATVLDAGAADSGRPYFVMELVRGMRITDFCDQHRLSTEQRLALFEQVCQAIQHAHQKGIIHRDIKPSNILVTQRDDVAVPKVIDFGIAKAMGGHLTDKTLFTCFQQFIGTPHYMSPEQAGLSGQDIDTRSDIYALGVLLYELLTGRTPFETKELAQAGLEEMFRRIREVDPPKPSTRLRGLGPPELTTTAQRRQADPPRLINRLRGDLDWIVMKCLEKDRSHRYATTNALAMDIQRHLKHQPVTAAAPTWNYRLAKFARRNRAPLAAAAAFALLLAAGTVVSVLEAVRATRNAAAADREATRASRLAQAESQQRERAEASARESRDLLVRLDLANGNRLLEAGDHFGALAWFSEAMTQDRDRPERAAAHQLRLTTLLKQSPKLLGLWCDAVVADLSKNGQSMLTIDASNTMRLLDPTTGRALVPPLQLTNPFTAAGLSPDASQILFVLTNAAQLWDARSGELQFTLDHQWVEQAEFSSDGRLLATASRNSTTKVWERATGRLALPVLRHKIGWRNTQHPAVLSFSPDGTRLVTAAYDHDACVWDLTTGKLLFTLAHDADVRYAQFSPDGRRIATANWASKAHLWDALTGQAIGRPLPHEGMVDHVTFSPRGEWLVSSSLDGTAKMWDAETGQLLRTYSDGKGFVLGTEFSPDGHKLLLRKFAGQVQAWSAHEVKPLSPPLPHPERPDAAQFLPDGQRIWTYSPDGTARVWDLQPEGLAFQWPANEHVALVQVSPGGKWILTENSEGSLQVWNTTNWQAKPLSSGSTNGILHALFSRDERRLLTITAQPPTAETNECVLRLEFKEWDLEKQALLHQASVPAHCGNPSRAVFAMTPDCRQAAMSAGRNVEAWDLMNGATLWRSTNHGIPRDVVLLSYSPDGRTLAFNCGRSLHVLDATTGKRACPDLTNVLLASSLDFSPDGRYLAGASSDVTYNDGEARIWESATGKLTNRWRHKDGVLCVSFSPDGRRLATGDESQNAHIFDAVTGKAVTPPMRCDDRVRYVRFSPDGRMLATALVNHTFRVWDALDGQPITPPIQTSGEISQILFLPESRYLATRGRETWQLWDLQMEGLAAGELQLLAQVLSRQQIGSTGVLEPVSNAVLSNSWARLHQTPLPYFVSGQERPGALPDSRLHAAAPCLLVPARDPSARPNLLDLGPFYNASLWDDLVDEPGNNLQSLPHGLQTFGSVEFDVRGVVQLNGQGLQERVGQRYPKLVAGIGVKQTCRRFHVLFGTAWPEAEGVKIGAFVVRYADGQQVELPLAYGKDVLDWWGAPAAQEQQGMRSAVAWTGQNAATGRLRLYQETWENPRAEVEINSLDFISTMTRCAPFLLAVSVD